MTQVLNPTQNPQAITTAAEALIQGQIVALPTETVYGLAANALDPVAVKKIFDAKERPSFDPLIVHGSDQWLEYPSTVAELVNQGILSASTLALQNKIDAVMKKFWPGPLTLILERGHRIPDIVTSGRSTVGIRIPNHPVFQAVLSKISFPLAAPSANRFGRISPTTADHVLSELNGRIPLIIDGGNCQVGLESTIVQLFDDHFIILRPGKITAAEIEVAYGSPEQPFIKQETHNKSQPGMMAPGMMDEHYAPKKSLFLYSKNFSGESIQIPEWADPFWQNKKWGLIAMNQPPNLINGGYSDACKSALILSPTHNLDTMAQRLYDALRTLDNNPVIDAILIDVPVTTSNPNEQGLVLAIRDRLNRASRNKPF
jgi:L-threonylcarbamoyladenylate synthase